MCTQCSGSHGLGASEVPRGQDLPLTEAHTSSQRLWAPAESSLLRKPTSCGLSWPWGSRCLPQQPRQAVQRTVSPWFPVSVPSNLLPIFPGTWGPCLLLPLSVSSLHAAMFLCCQNGPFSPGSAFGVGAGFLSSHTLEPQPGNSGHQVPFTEPPLAHSAFPGVWLPSSAPAWTGLQVAVV